MLAQLMVGLSLSVDGFKTGCKAAVVAANEMSTGISSAMASAAADTRAAKRDTDSLNNSMSTLGKAFVGSAIIAGLYSVSKAAIEAEIKMEALQIQFLAVFKSANNAALEFNNMREMSNRLGLDLLVTANSYSRFQGAAMQSNLTAKQALSAFNGLQTGFAGLHLSAETAGRVMIQFNQMLSKGKVQAQDMKIIAESVPGAYGMMAEAMGLKGAQFFKMMRTGALDATTAIIAMGKQMEKEFADAAEKASTQLQANINRYNNKMLDAKVALGKELAPAFGSLLQIMGYLCEKATQFVKIINAGAISLAHIVTVIEIKTDGKALKTIKKNVKDAWDSTGGVKGGPASLLSASMGLGAGVLQAGGQYVASDSSAERDRRMKEENDRYNKALDENKNGIKPTEKTKEERRKEQERVDRRTQSDADARNEDAAHKLSGAFASREEEVRKAMSSFTLALNTQEASAGLSDVEKALEKVKLKADELSENKYITRPVTRVTTFRKEDGSLGSTTNTSDEKIQTTSQKSKDAVAAAVPGWNKTAIDTVLNAADSKIQDSIDKTRKKLDGAFDGMEYGDKLSQQLKAVSKTVEEEFKGAQKSIDAAASKGYDVSEAKAKLEMRKSQKVIAEQELMLAELVNKSLVSATESSEKSNADLALAKAEASMVGLSDLQASILKKQKDFDNSTIKEKKEMVAALAEIERLKLSITGSTDPAVIKTSKMEIERLNIIISKLEKIASLRSGEKNNIKLTAEQQDTNAFNKKIEDIDYKTGVDEKNAKRRSNMVMDGGFLTDYDKENAHLDIKEGAENFYSGDTKTKSQEFDAATKTGDVEKIKIAQGALDTLDATISAMSTRQIKLFDDKALLTNIENIKKVTSATTLAKEGTMAMVEPLATALETFAKTGKMNVGELAKNLADSLKMMAAQKTAFLLMTALEEGILGLVDAASDNEVNASLHFEAAAAAVAGAAVMGSFVLGSAIGAMAHDGITDIPREGTWLLDKGERVVDSKTNQDLKSFLKEGGGQSVGDTTVNVTINGGDEASIMKSLPKMKQTIIDAVHGDIAGNGRLRSVIQQYAK